MKWVKDAKEGIVVAGGQGQENSLSQLNNPRGIFVDEMESVYIVDSTNHPIVCWPKGSNKCEIVVGGNGVERQSNQFNGLACLMFDDESNLCVSDSIGNYIQKFSNFSNEQNKPIRFFFLALSSLSFEKLFFST